MDIETSCALAQQNECNWDNLAVADRRRLGARVCHSFRVNGKRQDFIGVVVTRVAHDHRACPTCGGAGAHACRHVWGVLWDDNEQSDSSCLCFDMLGLHTQLRSMQVTSTQAGGSHHS